jgi:3-dehydroquinate synthase
MIKTLEINFAKSYPIYMGLEVLRTQLVAYCQGLKERLVIITDSHIKNTLGLEVQQLLQGVGLSVELFSFPAGEAHKTRETKAQVEDLLFAKGYGRDTCLIALGGGVVTDLVGFIAATYCRGVPVIYVPTTLLAMVDASIGGKTGVDTPFGKNLVGTFYQPHAVFMDLKVLETLPEHEWCNGIVEMLKHGLIADAALFNALKTQRAKLKEPQFLLEMIFASCVIKKNMIEQDERDYGIRQLLNFGHTIGHAIELIEDYKISHGEAVAIGMLVEARLSVLSGFLEPHVVDEIEQVLRDYGLPLKTNAFEDIQRLKALLGLDKKALANVAQFVLLDAIGVTHFENNKHVVAVKSEILDAGMVNI